MPAPDLKDRIALITGAAGGIGQALARAFVGAGLRVALCDTSKDALLRLHRELGPDRTIALPMDVSDPASCRDSVARTVADFGRLDVLVNNAAVGMSTVREDHMRRVVQIEDIAPELWARFMAVNLSGPFYMAHAAVPGMRARKFGRIINVTTSFFTMLNPGFSPYGPAKAGLEAWSASLAGELKGTGITVNVVVPGGPSHWSFGAGMTWLTGHWEWHALCCYVLVPRDGEPTMIYSMGGTHAEAVRRHVEVAVKDVRHSRNGQYAQVMVERLRELKLEKGRIGLMEIDPRHGDYMPVNQYNTLRKELPNAEFVFTKNFLHDLVVIHSKEELDCVRKAGVLCQNAMEAMVARAKPGVKEYELKAAAAAAIMDGGGDIDFLIIGSTPMDNPALIFGNPRPSGRMLKKGDMVNMELAAGYRGYTAQIGSPITLGPPTDMVRKFWDEITLPGYNKIVAEMLPGKNAKAMQDASRFFRDKGVQSRPTQCHGIDIVTDNPHITSDHIGGLDSDMMLKPGMIIMAEPNPITADGMFGIFLGHTYIITDTGREIVDDFPLEIAVAG